MKRGKSRPVDRRRQRPAVDLVTKIAQLFDQEAPASRVPLELLPAWTELYLELREIGRALNHKLIDLCHRDDSLEAARRLGILEQGTIVFGSESEMHVWGDHMLYHARIGGRSAFEHFMVEHRPAPDSLEAMWLQSAMRARFTLLLVTDTIQDFGLVMRDILTGDELIIADLNFSRTAAPGLSLAARVLPLGQFGVLSGAALPIFHEQVLLKIGNYIARTCSQFADLGNLPSDRALWLESFILQTCLESNAGDRVGYADPI